MEALTAALGKLEGMTRDTGDNISDDMLFNQPPPNEDCLIGLLRLPTLEKGSTMFVVEKLFAMAAIMHQ